MKNTTAHRLLTIAILTLTAISTLSACSDDKDKDKGKDGKYNAPGKPQADAALVGVLMKNAWCMPAVVNGQVGQVLLHFHSDATFLVQGVQTTPNRVALTHSEGTWSMSGEVATGVVNGQTIAGHVGVIDATQSPTHHQELVLTSTQNGQQVAETYDYCVDAPSPVQ